MSSWNPIDLRAKRSWRLALLRRLCKIQSMPLCPNCKKELDTVPQRQGVYHNCPNCNGRALSVPQIRRVAGDHFAVRLLRLLKMREEQNPLTCPFCQHRMRRLKIQKPSLELAGCRPCNIVWFDAQTYQSIPEWTVANNTSVSMQDIETESLRRLKEIKEKEKAAAQEEKRRKSLRRSFKTLWDHKP